MDLSLTRREMLMLISYASLEVTGVFSPTAFASEKSLRKAFRRFAKQDNIEPLRMTGKLYLESNPDEGDIGVLLQSLPQAEGIDDSYWDAFEKQIRSDFVSGETVSLDGWVLSRSECRLYGLFHLVTT